MVSKNLYTSRIHLLSIYRLAILPSPETFLYNILSSSVTNNGLIHFAAFDIPFIHFFRFTLLVEKPQSNS